MGVLRLLVEKFSGRTEFCHTTGTRREDGAYVVERRGADSAGHRKVFDSPDALRSMYADLPETFRASDVGDAGLTGSRRHMVVWHLIEHPAFDCELAARQPLSARKEDGQTSEGFGNV